MCENPLKPHKVNTHPAPCPSSELWKSPDQKHQEEGGMNPPESQLEFLDPVIATKATRNLLTRSWPWGCLLRTPDYLETWGPSEVQREKSIFNDLGEKSGVAE